MNYPNISPATFLARPNRFIAHVLLNGQEIICHVKNTGRCRELLIPGCTVYVQHCPSPTRKTEYDLIAVDKGGLLINMDAQAPNKLFQAWAEGGHFRPNLTLLRPETTFGDSRFDFYWEDNTTRGFVEVKGCTLEENKIARFPDAPTLRGVKHIEGLISAKNQGYDATIVLIIQMEGITAFRPNDETHPQFGTALRAAQKAGVTIKALGCTVTPDTIQIAQDIPIILS